MARKINRNKQRTSRYLSLAQPFELNLNDNEEGQTTNAIGEPVGLASPDVDEEEKQRRIDALGGNTLLARDSSLSSPQASPSASRGVPQSNKGIPSYTEPTTNVVSPTTTDVSRGIINKPPLDIRGRNPYAIPQSSLPSFAQDERTLALDIPPNALLRGEVDTNQLAQSLLSKEPQATGNELIAPLSSQFPQAPAYPPSVKKGETAGVAPGAPPKPPSPEEKLLQALSKTNPTPRSWYKRLLIGAARGASMIEPNTDTLGSAFGRIVGGSVAQLVPQVDVEQQKEKIKREAIERYKVEAEARNQTRQQQKLEADIQRSNAQLEEAKNRRLELRDARAKTQLDRLEDNKRQKAQQLLTALEKLPKDDAQRYAIAKRLRDEFDVPASANYGLKNETETKGAITIYDEATDTYIRATPEGKPILRDGKPIVVRPGATQRPETRAEKYKRINEEEIAKEGTVEAIAPGFVDNNKILYSLPAKQREILLHPEKADEDDYKAAEAARVKKYNEALKVALAETKSRREANIAARMEEEAASPRQSKGKIQASPRNATGTRDFRNPRVVKLPVK